MMKCRHTGLSPLHISALAALVILLPIDSNTSLGQTSQDGESPLPKAIRPSTEKEAEAMRVYVERKRREQAEWKKEVERRAHDPEWLKISKNIVALEIAGLLDPVGLSIDEATRGNPDEQVQLHAKWIKTVSSLLGSANSADDVVSGVVEFAKSNLNGELRERVISMVAESTPGSRQVLSDTLTLNLPNNEQLELILIPAGEFKMGSPATEGQRDSDEGPQHRVKISKPFYMGKYEVTQAQWKAVMGNTRNFSGYKGDDLPVEKVSWHDCQKFCLKLSEIAGREIRLPSEAEWEYACRARTTTPFWFGKAISSAQANHTRKPFRTTAVGSFPASAFGLHDMHGNVTEWCEDVYHDSYAGAPSDGSAWVTGGDQNSRVVRGGSWGAPAKFCRSASRDEIWPDIHSKLFGFRIVSRTP